jgi:ribosomal protein S30
MIVEENSSLFSFFAIAKPNDTRKLTPQMKAKRDKNKSQRIRDFRLK